MQRAKSQRCECSRHCDRLSCSATQSECADALQEVRENFLLERVALLYPKCGMQTRCIRQLRLLMLDAKILSVCIDTNLCGGVKGPSAERCCLALICNQTYWPFLLVASCSEATEAVVRTTIFPLASALIYHEIYSRKRRPFGSVVGPAMFCIAAL